MRLARMLGLLALAGAIACTPSEERAKQARIALAEALERGDRPTALATIEDLRSALPDTADALLEVAAAMVRAGSAPDAAWLLEAGIRRFPERHDLRLALARVALLLANPTLALEAVHDVAPESPHHPEALLARAQAELTLGDLEAALEVLAEAESLYPDRPEARLARIATLLREHRRDDARAQVEAFQKELAGDDPETRALAHRLHLMLAQLQAQQGQTDEAIASLEALVSDDPKDPAAWQALLQVLQRVDPRRALARAEEGLAAEEPLVGLHAVAAELHAALGDPDAAERALRRYVEEADSPAAYLPLVLHYSERDEPDAAVTALDAAIERYPDEASLHLLRAESLLASGRIEDARDAVSRHRETTFEGDPQADYLQARLDLAEDRLEPAVEMLSSILPRLDRAPTHYWLGVALEASGDIEGARRRYSLALRRDPTWAAPAAALVSIARARRDWPAMASHARTLTRRLPERPDGWSAWVEALVQLGRADEAAAVAERAVAKLPERPEVRHLPAVALRAQGRFDEALAALDAAEEAGGTMLAAERVHTLGAAGRFEEAIALAREALAAEPERAGLHAELAALYFAVGAAEEGAAATDRALALAPGSLEPLRVRCQFRVATGAPGAGSDCERYLDANPEDAEVHAMLGLVRARKGDAEGAVASYRRASKLDPSDPRPRNNLAELLAARGDLDAALAEAQEAYRLAPADANVQDTLGALYLRAGLADRAVALLEPAHAAAPNAPGIALNLARAYRDAGRVEPARALLAKLRDEEDAAVRARAEEVLDSLP